MFGKRRTKKLYRIKVDPGRVEGRLKKGKFEK